MPLKFAKILTRPDTRQVSTQSEIPHFVVSVPFSQLWCHQFSRCRTLRRYRYYYYVIIEANSLSHVAFHVTKVLLILHTMDALLLWSFVLSAMWLPFTQTKRGIMENTEIVQTSRHRWLYARWWQRLFHIRIYAVVLITPRNNGIYSHSHCFRCIRAQTMEQKMTIHSWMQIHINRHLTDFLKFQAICRLQKL